MDEKIRPQIDKTNGIKNVVCNNLAVSPVIIYAKYLQYVRQDPDKKYMIYEFVCYKVLSFEQTDFQRGIDDYGERIFRRELWFKGWIQSGMEITGFAILVSYIFVRSTGFVFRGGGGTKIRP